ncbi:MAG: hypothetical protein U0359_41405 [Byssovorax sp.]
MSTPPSHPTLPFAPPFAFALALLSTAACSRHSEQISPKALSSGGRWREAYVTVEYHPSFYQTGKSHSAEVTHELFIEEAPPNRAMVILSMRREDELDAADFRALRNTAYTLRFSPDGKAVAASTDEGHTFTVLDLAPLEVPMSWAHPFWCRHHSFTTLAPWPSLHPLAIEILSSVDPSSPAAKIHRTPAAVWPGPVPPPRGNADWHEELDGASQIACLHTDDPALRKALVEAALHPDYPVTAHTCLREIFAADPALKQRVITALPTASPAVRMRMEQSLEPSKPGR